jgi:phosphatidylglycerol:prolipoprotein diacylglycerol transferase
MKPVIFTIPFIDRDVPGYGLMLMIGFLLAIWWATRRGARSGANPDVILNCGFIALIAGIVGCRAMYVIHYWDQFKARGDALSILWAIIDITKGGLEFYGGFVLSTVLTLAWLRWREKVSIRWYMDIIAPSAALGLAIGRIGCFLNGCCYGGVCDLPWAVQFPAGSPAAHTQWQDRQPGAGLPEQLLYVHSPGVIVPLTRESLAASDQELKTLDETVVRMQQRAEQLQSQLAAAGDPQQKRELRAEVAKVERKRDRAKVKYIDLRTNMKKYGMTADEIRALAARHRSLPVHPTQLYSTVTALLIAFFLNSLYWRRTRDGQVILTLLVIEPVSRWMLEVIRADNPVDTLGMFTISQGLALAMTALGLIGLFALRYLPARSPRARRWEPAQEQKSVSRGRRGAPAAD